MGLIGGVVLAADVDRITVFLHGSQIPEAYDIGCLHVLHIAIGLEDEVIALLLNLKSKLDLADAMSVADVRGRSDAEVRWVLDERLCPSLFLAFSTAIFSYSSHTFAVFPGVHGGVRGSLKGELVLANGDG